MRCFVNHSAGEFVVVVPSEVWSFLKDQYPQVKACTEEVLRRISLNGHPLRINYSIWEDKPLSEGRYIIPFLSKSKNNSRITRYINMARMSKCLRLFTVIAESQKVIIYKYTHIQNMLIFVCRQNLLCCGYVSPVPRLGR